MYLHMFAVFKVCKRWDRKVILKTFVYIGLNKLSLCICHQRIKVEFFAVEKKKAVILKTKAIMNLKKN